MGLPGSSVIKWSRYEEVENLIFLNWEHEAWKIYYPKQFPPEPLCSMCDLHLDSHWSVPEYPQDGNRPGTPGCILLWEDIVPATSQALCVHPRRLEGLEFSNCQVFSIHFYRLQVWRPPICPTCLEPKLASGRHGPISSFPTNFILGTVFLMLSLRALPESPWEENSYCSKNSWKFSNEVLTEETSDEINQRLHSKHNVTGCLFETEPKIFVIF